MHTFPFVLSSHTLWGPPLGDPSVSADAIRNQVTPQVLSSAHVQVCCVVLASRPSPAEPQGQSVLSTSLLLPQPGHRCAQPGLLSPQGAYSAFVYSYAVEKPLSVGHKMAGYLPSLFWGFITLGRLISIPVSSRMRPATMVFINVVSG